MATISTTGPAGLRSARIIAAAMIAGVTLFALVAWFLVQTGGPMSDPAATGILGSIWPLVAVAAAAAAMVIWRTRIAPLIGRVPDRAEPGAARHDAALQVSLVIHWALMEGPAVFGIAVYLLTGSLVAYAGGLLLVWLGVGLTFPRPHWFVR